MELREAKNEVIEMGKTLLRTGLIARSWGNISCRLNDHQFLITPSGRSYATLTPEELVIVNMSDEKHWGHIMPSLETGVHLDIYKLRPHINGVIHTHQTQASALSAMNIGLPASYDQQFQGTVRCSSYGFPGSDVLRHSLREEFLNGTGNAVLMSHHGAVCMGEKLSEAFRCSFLLERSAEQFCMEGFQRSFGEEWANDSMAYEKVMHHLGLIFPEDVFVLYDSYKTTEEMILEPDSNLLNYKKAVYDDVMAEKIHEAIYAARPDLRYVRQCYHPEVLAYTARKKSLDTYIDDFAQINGPVMEYASLDPQSIVKALGDNHGVLLEQGGAICCGSTLDDVEALTMVTEKNVHAWFVSQFFQEQTLLPIPLEECEKMRHYYLEKYSKRF